MTDEGIGAWVGDQVYDEVARKEGIVTDVKGGTFILRELHTWARTWTAPNAKKLRVTVSREQRLKQREEI
ncbi:hypothetical protein ACWDTR_24865 [Streptomyces sp. NPDC003470]